MKEPLESAETAARENASSMGVVEYVVWGDAFRITNDTTPASQVAFLTEDVRTHKLTKAKSVRPFRQPMSDSSTYLLLVFL
jgi:hypothetical protein